MKIDLDLGIAMSDNNVHISGVDMYAYIISSNVKKMSVKHVGMYTEYHGEEN